MLDKARKVFIPFVSIISIVYFSANAERRRDAARSHSFESVTLNALEYKVLFTNPICKAYPYSEDREVRSVAGEKLVAKPANVYCTKQDWDVSASKPDSPQRELLRWIADDEVEEIFIASFSFSNSVIRDGLCKAVTGRGMRLTVVLDEGTDHALAKSLLKCVYERNGEWVVPELLLRGDEGGIQFAHNKLLIANPGKETLRIAFGSGNFSNGAVLHHENWHFITVPHNTFFAQAHLCLKEGVISHAQSKKAYSGFIAQCKATIEYPEESDIKTLFIPGEGRKAEELLFDAMENADRIWMAAHRFSHNKLRATLATLLRERGGELDVRLVADDDIYWAGHRDRPYGGNTFEEYTNVTALEAVGMKTRYLETNAADNLFQHNKFVIALREDGGMVFAGAGNLTNAAFTNNFENFYAIEIPAIVEAFETQYRHMWEELATATEDLPSENVLPQTNQGL